MLRRDLYIFLNDLEVFLLPFFLFVHFFCSYFLHFVVCPDVDFRTGFNSWGFCITVGTCGLRWGLGNGVDGRPLNHQDDKDTE